MSNRLVLWAVDEPLLTAAIRRKGWDRNDSLVYFFILTPEEIVKEIAEGFKQGVPDVIVSNSGHSLNPSIQFKSNMPEFWRLKIRRIVYDILCADDNRPLD